MRVQVGIRVGRDPLALAVLGVLLAAAVVAGRLSAAAGDPLGSSVAADPRAGAPVQSGSNPAEEDVAGDDLALIARERGWTAEEAAAYARAEAALGLIGARLAAERPEAYVGIALAEEPDGVPSLYVKGTADPWVRELVAMAPVPIRIVEGQPYSLAELEARARVVHEALLAAGFGEVATSFDLRRGGVIEVTVRAAPDLAGGAGALLDLLPAELRPDVEIRLVDGPVVGPPTSGDGS